MRVLLLRIGFLGAVVLFAVMGCGKGSDNSTATAPKNAFSEQELSADPGLRIKPGQTVAMLLEPSDARGTTHADGGSLGVDIIPIRIEQEGVYTYSLDESDVTRTVRAEMVRLPERNTLFELNDGSRSISVTLAPGEYEMTLSSNYTVASSGGADHRVVFLHPETQKAISKIAAASRSEAGRQILSGSCSGCDLGKANLAGVNLAGVNLAGSNLSGADLTNADITKANLVDADTTGTLWFTGAPGRSITLVNNCSIDVWAAAAGNDAPQLCESNAECGGGECDKTNKDVHFCKQVFCGKNAECPNNAYCGGLAPFSDKACTKDEDCGANRFCGKDNKLCGWHTCKFVPLPVTDMVKPAKACTSNADCCAGSGSCNSFCLTTVSHSGYCAMVPAAEKGNSWLMKAATATASTQTIPVPTPWGGRFWPRTACGYQGSPCDDRWAGTDAQCGEGRTRISDKSQHYSMNCRTDDDCVQELDPGTHKPTANVGGRCLLTDAPGFPGPPPEMSECTIGDDTTCDSKGKNWVCIAQEKSTKDGTIQIGRCGFRRCTSYQCTGLGEPLCEPRTFTCETGKCLGEDNRTFSENCRGSGKDSPTLAELYMPLFYRYDSRGRKTAVPDADFYDVSLVDGANLPLQIAPDPRSYALTSTDVSCKADEDCWDRNRREGHDLACLKIDGKTEGKCVNKYRCGSPGCASASECDKYGHGHGLVKPSAWGGRNMAILEKDCKEELKLKGNGAYIACMSPKDACGLENPNAALHCQSGISGQGTYLQLYACDGPISGVSCYSDGAPGTCCGCPSWTAAPFFCAGTNREWTAIAQPYFDIFHKASPTSYSFPFDDFSSTFTCAGKKEDVLVNYTVTFCPKK